MIKKIENKLINDDDDYFLYLKIPLYDKITWQFWNGKKNIKFSTFHGSQDSKMHVRKFQEVIEFVHDYDMLAKLFSHSLNDDALKWYFTISKKKV